MCVSLADGFITVCSISSISSKFMMPFLNRKLLVFSIQHYGDDDSTCSGSRHKCPSVLLPPTPHLHPKHKYNNTTITMSVMVFAVAASLLVCFLVAIIRRYWLRQNVRDSGAPVLFRMRVDSLQEDDHGGVDSLQDDDHVGVDHPIWLINTAGLDQSVIDSIAVCEFKKGDGLIDGMECTICLGEFVEGEDLRLLPKCSHAFHVPCIDTWLRSHKNCPLCRAPIVRDVLLPCGEINLEESRFNRGILGRSSTTVSGNEDERNSEGEGGSGGEKEVRKENGIRPKRSLSSIHSSSVMETRRTTAIDNRTRKNDESSRNIIRKSSSDAGILSFEKSSRQTPIHLF